MSLLYRQGWEGQAQPKLWQRRGEDIRTTEGPSPRRKSWLPEGQDVTAVKVGVGAFPSRTSGSGKRECGGARERRLQEEGGNPT